MVVTLNGTTRTGYWQKADGTYSSLSYGTGDITRDLSSKLKINAEPVASNIGRITGYYRNLVVYNKALTAEEINNLNF